MKRPEQCSYRAVAMLVLAAVGCSQRSLPAATTAQAGATAPTAVIVPPSTTPVTTPRPPPPAAMPPAAGTVAVAGTSSQPATAGVESAGSGGSAPEPSEPAAIRCKPRPFTKGDATLHMHHIHFNATDPDANIALIQKFFSGHPDDFCVDETTPRVTRAVKTERAYFLYTQTATAPPSMRNTRLAHVGFNSTDVPGELKRMLALNVPLADEAACATARQGTPCNTFNVQWFYVETPEGARFEVAAGPGPSTSGFGHIHLVAPTYGFYQKVLGDALHDVGQATVNVSDVNITNSGNSGMLVDGVIYVPTRGTVLDHIAYSTTDLEATLARIQAAGVMIEEPISFKSDYGFRSFFVKSDEGVWVEIVEDAVFAP